MVVSPKVGCFSGYRKFFWFYFGFVSYESSQGSFPRGILQISSDRDDRRILGGLKFSIPEFFGWEILASIFFGWLDLSSDFLRGIQNNLKICGKACVSRSSSTANKGTVPNSSTVHALISMLHNWCKNTDGNGSTVRVVLFDFRKHSISSTTLNLLIMSYHLGCWTGLQIFLLTGSNE